MNLPLYYLNPVNTCPFPVSRLTFQILLVYSEFEDQRQRLSDWWMNAKFQANQYYAAQGLRSRYFMSRRTPTEEEAQLMREYPEYTPQTQFHSTELCYGELVKVPSILSNRDLYKWGTNGASLFLPYFLLLVSNAQHARAAYNGLEMLQAKLYRRTKGTELAGDYSAALLWMMFSGRAQKYYREHPDPALIEAVGNLWLLEHLAYGGIPALEMTFQAVVKGLMYMAGKGKANGKTDA